VNSPINRLFSVLLQTIVTFYVFSTGSRASNCISGILSRDINRQHYRQLAAFPTSSHASGVFFDDNSIGQIKSGSNRPNKQTDLNSLAIAPSVGALAFVPEGFAGASRLKITSMVQISACCLPWAR
jgi:hypothetical protein